MADQKVVVITGCSSGIGLETACLLAKDGNLKVIATMRNLAKKEDLEKTAGESLNKSLFIEELDVSKEDSIKRFMKAAYENVGRIDILINNAASCQHCAFESVTSEQMHSLFETNFFGAVRMTQEVVRKMKEQRSGHIIFISTISAVNSLPFSDFYVASKCALEGIIGSLAPVLRHFNVHVTSIQPGPVTTSVVENIVKNNQGAAFDPTRSDIDEDVDELTATLRQNVVKNVLCVGPDLIQSSSEVAEVIKTTIYEGKPPVMVQTSSGMEKIAKGILVDNTGGKTVGEMEAMLK